MTEKQIMAVAHYRLLQSDMEYHKKNTSVQEAEATGLYEALLKTEDYLLKTALNLHK